MGKVFEASGLREGISSEKMRTFLSVGLGRKDFTPFLSR
jgi:hypothetical protein